MLQIYGDHGKDDMFIADMRGYAQIIRNMADSIPLVENQNLFFNNYVTEVSRTTGGPLLSLLCPGEIQGTW